MKTVLALCVAAVTLVAGCGPDPLTLEQRMSVLVEQNRQLQMELLKRDPTPGAGDKNDQAHAFTALGLPAGAKLWSKAGWTSQARHDAAYVELPGGAKFVLVTFTVDHASEREIIATVAKIVVEGLSAAH